MSEALAGHFQYLDDLRASGRTNMYAASMYLMEERGLHEVEARRVARLWMETFDGETSLPERVAKARSKS